MNACFVWRILSLQEQNYTVVTRNARLIGVSKEMENLSVYTKKCPCCNFEYRYQEWKDGFHNFNNHLFLSLKLFDLIIRGLEEHIAIGSFAETLVSRLQAAISLQTIRSAVLHFCCMLEYEYTFNCVQCGYYPPILTSNLKRKCVFNIAVSQLEELEPNETNDHINIDKFWNSVESEIITKGFIKKGEKDPCQKIPTYKFWGPWIGQKSRVSNVIPNTEY